MRVCPFQNRPFLLLTHKKSTAKNHLTQTKKKLDIPEVNYNREPTKQIFMEACVVEALSQWSLPEWRLILLISNFIKISI